MTTKISYGAKSFENTFDAICAIIQIVGVEQPDINLDVKHHQTKKGALIIASNGIQLNLGKLVDRSPNIAKSSSTLQTAGRAILVTLQDFLGILNLEAGESERQGRRKQVFSLHLEPDQLSNEASLYKDLFKKWCIAYSQKYGKDFSLQSSTSKSSLHSVYSHALVKGRKSENKSLGASRDYTQTHAFGISGYNRPKANLESDNLQIPLPGMPLPPDSNFYILRDSLQEDCLQKTSCPGSLIRIRGSSKRGKTSLITHLYVTWANQNLAAAMLSLRKDIDQSTISNLDAFLQWFCIALSKELGLAPALSEHWDSPAPMQNCKDYFEDYILEKINKPILIILDDVDTIFEFPEICQNFLEVIRGFYQNANRKKLWRNLHLVISHSTSPYTNLDLNRSPFNVGTLINLPDFTQQEIYKLFQSYKIPQTEQRLLLEALTDLVGYEPYLMQEALYAKVAMQLSLEKIVRYAHTPQGIYWNHLQELTEYIKSSQKGPAEDSSDLAHSLDSIISSQNSTKIPTEHLRKLIGLGVITQKDGKAVLRCKLYQKYFYHLYS